MKLLPFEDCEIYLDHDDITVCLWEEPEGVMFWKTFEKQEILKILYEHFKKREKK